MRRCTALAMVVGLALVLVGSSYAQENPGSKNKRTLYAVKYGAAKELAGILAKHFKTDAEIQVLPDSPSNCLLISAAPDVFAEILKLLEQLDRRPQMVAVELLVIEITPAKGADGKPEPLPKELDEKEFTGTSQEVLAKVQALRKKGLLGDQRRMQLTAVENQPANVRVGETKAVVMSVRTTPKGEIQRSYQYRDLGTLMDVKVRVAGEKEVVLELNLSDSRLSTPPNAVSLGKDENGMPILATEFVNATVKSTLRIPSGQAVAAQGVKTESKSGQSQTLIIVSVRIVDGDGKGGK